jgi:hypothetical protein
MRAAVMSAAIAMQEADDSGSPVFWGEHVTDEQYTRRADVVGPGGQSRKRIVERA